MPGPRRLEPRGNRAAPLVYRQGAHPPYAIRWYGATSLWGHFRNLVSTAIASESVDTRDWMRPLDAEEMLARVTSVLGLEAKGTLLESIDRPIWIDWVADTGDDRDVSHAVAEMLFAEYTVDEPGGPLTLPRGDILLFGGDTAYPVATADEIYRRVVQPWNEVLRQIDDPRETPRVLMGVPGNHDWYDGLDGFCRFFRRSANRDVPDRSHVPMPRYPRRVGRLARGLHLDEIGGAIETIAGTAKAARAVWRGESIRHRRRLALEGYEAVQESSYWALPLAPGLDLWGVDRQLRKLDYRQRGYFQDRHEAASPKAVWIAAPDPAIAYGEPWPIGQGILAGCGLSLEQDHLLYLCGDMHQYERRPLESGSLHVIAGGGGAFLHGTRIVADPKPAALAYPDAKTTRWLALQVPVRLMLGRAGYLVHMAAALVATIILAASWHHRERYVISSGLVCIAIAAALYTIAGHRRAHPRRVLALTVPFATAFGLLPLGLSVLLHHFAQVIPLLGRDTVVVVAYAFVAALLFGVFLTLCALSGLEIEQAFTVLGHPGFKHFARLRVSPDGTIDAWVIGKDDPLAKDGPWQVDRWTWKGRPG